MERVNHRANKANSIPIENQNESQAADYQHTREKKSSDERRIQSKKHFAIGTGREDGDEEEEDEEGEERDKEGSEGTLTPRMAAVLGLCAICHLTLNSINSGQQNVACSKGHALCHRCIQRYAMQSGPGCILCLAQLQQSNTSFSRESNSSLNSIYVTTKRTHEFPQQPQYYHANYQRMPSNTEQLIKPWAQNYPQGRKNAERYDMNSEINYCYGQITDQSKEDNPKIDSRQPQQRSYYSLIKRENQDPHMSEVKINGQITLECSRRPIHCPRIDCAINVAFSALTHHFLFDHPEVPVLNVDPGTKSTLIVSFGALCADSSRCLALLLVSGKLSGPVARMFNGNQINPKYRNRLPLPVLAARLHYTDRYTSCNKVSNDEEGYHEKYVIIAWVAGLDVGNTTERLKCSIQAVDSIDSEGLRSLTYTGPVNSLRSAQRPRDIFSSGDCIVLHEGLVSHITSDCTNLNVNVIVH